MRYAVVFPLNFRGWVDTKFAQRGVLRHGKKRGMPYRFFTKKYNLKNYGFLATPEIYNLFIPFQAINVNKFGRDIERRESSLTILKTIVYRHQSTFPNHVNLPPNQRFFVASVTSLYGRNNVNMYLIMVIGYTSPPKVKLCTIQLGWLSLCNKFTCLGS